MAKSVNKALLLGYVGKAPEIRSTASGTLVASLSLATAERQKDRQGNWTDRTEWHNLVAYGRTAEIVRDYVKKGTHSSSRARSRPVPGMTRNRARRGTAPRSSSIDLTLLGGGRGENAGSGYSNGRSESRQDAGRSENQRQEMDEPVRRRRT